HQYHRAWGGSPSLQQAELSLRLARLRVGSLIPSFAASAIASAAGTTPRSLKSIVRNSSASLTFSVFGPGFTSPRRCSSHSSAVIRTGSACHRATGAGSDKPGSVTPSDTNANPLAGNARLDLPDRNSRRP